MLFNFELRRGQSIEVARTIVACTIVVGQMAYLLNCRFLRSTSLTKRIFFGNRYIYISMGILAVLQLLYTYAPWMQDLFDTAPLRPKDWIFIIAMGLATFLIIEIDKAVERFFASRKGKPDF